MPAKQAEAAHLMALTGASVDVPVFPMALHTPALAWSDGMLVPRTGSALQAPQRRELVAAMRPLRLREMFELVGAAIRQDGADRVKLGY